MAVLLITYFVTYLSDEKKVQPRLCFPACRPPSKASKTDRKELGFCTRSCTGQSTDHFLMQMPLSVFGCWSCLSPSSSNPLARSVIRGTQLSGTPGPLIQSHICNGTVVLRKYFYYYEAMGNAQYLSQSMKGDGSEDLRILSLFSGLTTKPGWLLSLQPSRRFDRTTEANYAPEAPMSRTGQDRTGQDRARHG